MDPMSDLDRAIRDALHVEPPAHLATRIRARVAEESDVRLRLPMLAFAAIAFALVTTVAVSEWRPAEPRVVDSSLLAARDLVVFASLPVALPAPPALPGRASAAADVLISRSEMLALQRLFAGITIAPPELAAPADELSIPQLVIAPLLRGDEGERQ